eukprot:SAG22_NODE_15514_length_347_cov_0.629032_1_plen_76_part_01
MDPLHGSTLRASSESKRARQPAQAARADLAGVRPAHPPGGSPLAWLPPALVDLILGQLAAEDVLRAAAVCRRFRDG